MIHYFDYFTEEEIENYEELGFEVEGDGGLHHLDLDFTIYKHNDKVYAQIQEEEQCFQEMDGRIYLLDPVWYMKVNVEAILNDYHSGEVTPDDFYVENYELYEEQ